MSDRKQISKASNRLLMAACLLFIGCTKASQIGSKAVLNVDGTELKASVFASQLAEKLKHLDALTAKDPQVLDRAKEQIIRDFIISVLTDSWAKANGVFVKAEDLEARISRIRKDYPDDSTFQKSLAEQNLSFKDWRESISRTLLQELVVNHLKEKMGEPSDEECKSYYQNNKELYERPEQAHLRQVLLANEADAKLMEENLKKGKSFSDMAEKFSISPEGKKSKGDLGWIEKGIAEPFDQAFTLRPGARTGVIKSPYGYHIVELVGRRPAQIRPFEEVKKKIRQQLLANREQALYTSWLEGQVRKARILKDEELIRQIKVETKEE